MDPILASLAGHKAIQAVTGAVESVTDALTSDSTEQQGASEGSFEKVMRAFLNPDAANNVNEEELFAAVIRERITALKGEEAGAKFGEAFESHKAEMARADGYIPVEKAAKAALKGMVSGEELSSEEGDKIFSESFSAAQLDDNLTSLFDGRGSSDDATVAVMDFNSALEAARLKIENYDKGEEAAPDKTLNGADGSSSGASGSGDAAGGVKSPNDGAEGFLWKPKSEGDGKLVVLLPNNLNDLVSSVVITQGSEILAEGRFAGNEHNGARGHYRFDKSGGDFGDNLTVEVRLDSGEIIKYNIEDGSERYD